MSQILSAVTKYDLVRHLGEGVGQSCSGSKFHSPTPLVTGHVDIACMMRPHPGKTSELVWLCGVCVDNLRTFVYLMKATDGAMDWEVKREFGNRIRDLGMKAWTYHQEGERG